MATLIQWLSLGGVVVLCLGWLLYTPIPAGYKKPWQVRVAYTQANILWKMVRSSMSIHSILQKIWLVTQDNTKQTNKQTNKQQQKRL